MKEKWITLDEIDQRKNTPAALGITEECFSGRIRQIFKDYPRSGKKLAKRFDLDIAGILETIGKAKKKIKIIGMIVEIWKDKGREKITLEEAIATYTILMVSIEAVQGIKQKQMRRYN